MFSTALGPPRVASPRKTAPVDPCVTPRILRRDQVGLGAFLKDRPQTSRSRTDGRRATESRSASQPSPQLRGLLAGIFLPDAFCLISRATMSPASFTRTAGERCKSCATPLNFATSCAAEKRRHRSVPSGGTRLGGAGAARRSGARRPPSQISARIRRFATSGHRTVRSRQHRRQSCVCATRSDDLDSSSAPGSSRARFTALRHIGTVTGGHPRRLRRPLDEDHGPALQRIAPPRARTPSIASGDPRVDLAAAR